MTWMRQALSTERAVEGLRYGARPRALAWALQLRRWLSGGPADAAGTAALATVGERARSSDRLAPTLGAGAGAGAGVGGGDRRAREAAELDAVGRPTLDEQRRDVVRNGLPG